MTFNVISGQRARKQTNQQKDGQAKREWKSESGRSNRNRPAEKPKVLQLLGSVSRKNGRDDRLLACFFLRKFVKASLAMRSCVFPFASGWVNGLHWLGNRVYRRRGRQPWPIPSCLRSRAIRTSNRIPKKHSRGKCEKNVEKKRRLEQLYWGRTI